MSKPETIILEARDGTEYRALVHEENGHLHIKFNMFFSLVLDGKSSYQVAKRILELLNERYGF